MIGNNSILYYAACILQVIKSRIYSIVDISKLPDAVTVASTKTYKNIRERGLGYINFTCN